MRANRPELLTIFIIAEHQDFTWNLFKVVTYCNVTFRTFDTVKPVDFHQLLQSHLSNRYL